MKSNIQRAIKVLSSFVTIFMVLICTVAMPVFAAGDNYSLADLYVTYSSNDNELIFTYDTGSIEPYVQIYNEDGSLYTQGKGSYFNVIVNQMVPEDEDDADIDKANIGISFFGSPAYTYKQTGLLDISDLKKYTTFDMEYVLDVDLGMVSAHDYIEFRYYLSMYYYDASLNHISTAKTVTKAVRYDVTAAQHLISDRVSLSLPEGACYIAPRLVLAIYSPNFQDDCTFYVDVRSSQIRVSIDSVLENSLTMQRIEDKLGDIDDSLENINQSIDSGNDKLDEIIEGNDDMHNAAQDSKEEMDALDKEAHDAMDNIDEKTDIGDALDVGAQFEALLDQWLVSGGFKALAGFFRPLLASGYFPTIFLMVVACINISVLLMGR